MLSPFYQWNEALPARAGVMLRTEPLPVQPELTAAGLSQRILYTSSDARWQSGIVPVSGTLYLPRGAAPKGGWPLVAWAHGTLGVADGCAPSWAQHRPRDATYLNRWLENGFAVVATDYQGLGGPGPHPYLIWEAEGRSVLDSVRAALAAHADQIANEVIITGQSQGSGSSIGASRIASEYAPELKVRAGIATGVVSSFPDGPYKLQDASLGAGAPSRFTVLRLIGGSLPDSGPTADSLMSDKGRAVLQAARNGCVDEMRGIEQREKIDAGNAFAMEPARLDAMLKPVTNMSLVKIGFPLFLGTGLADRTLPPRRQYAAATALCAAGNAVTWNTYPGITHNGIVNAAFDDELAFVRRTLRSEAAVSNCQAFAEPSAPGTPTPGIRFND
ncbi:MAG TPA: lipase family protein [Noviherbaspirillum sp.]